MAKQPKNGNVLQFFSSSHLNTLDLLLKYAQICSNVISTLYIESHPRSPRTATSSHFPSRPRGMAMVTLRGTVRGTVRGTEGLADAEEPPSQRDLRRRRRRRHHGYPRRQVWRPWPRRGQISTCDLQKICKRSAWRPTTAMTHMTHGLFIYGHTY